MTVDRIRKLARKLTPYVLGGLVLGGAGAAIKRHFFGDCCVPGSSCCYPGSPCCHHHDAAGGVAQR